MYCIVKKHEVAAVQGLGEPDGSHDILAKLLKTQADSRV